MNLDTLFSLVGDTPVSEQIATALKDMAPKAHIHTECADNNEVQELKRKIDLLLELVGDTSVADQIAIALKNIK